MRYGFVLYVTEIVLEIQEKNVPRHLLCILLFLNNQFIVANKSNKQNCKSGPCVIFVYFLFLDPCLTDMSNKGI